MSRAFSISLLAVVALLVRILNAGYCYNFDFYLLILIFLGRPSRLEQILLNVMFVSRRILNLFVDMKAGWTTQPISGKTQHFD